MVLLLGYGSFLSCQILFELFSAIRGVYIQAIEILEREWLVCMMQLATTSLSISRMKAFYMDGLIPLLLQLQQYDNYFVLKYQSIDFNCLV